MVQYVAQASPCHSLIFEVSKSKCWTTSCPPYSLRYTMIGSSKDSGTINPFVTRSTDASRLRWRSMSSRTVIGPSEESRVNHSCTAKRVDDNDHRCAAPKMR